MASHISTNFAIAVAATAMLCAYTAAGWSRQATTVEVAVHRSTGVVSARPAQGPPKALCTFGEPVRWQVLTPMPTCSAH